MEWFSRNKYWITGAFLFALSVTLRFLSASQTAHPTGWDGYYYVMQVHSWFTYGHLQSADFSLIYLYFAAIAFITHNYILSYQVGVALLSGLLSITVYYSLIKRNVSFGWVCLVSSYLLFSPLTTYFILQFPKNVLGLIFLVLFVENLKNKTAAATLLLATLMTHRMTGAFALIVMSIFMFKNVSWKWILTGSVVIILISFLPGILHISDLARFSDQFELIPHWSPYSFSQLLPLDIFFRVDLVIVSLLIIISIILNFRRPDLHWLVVGLVCIFPFFVFSPGSVGYRFFLVAPIAFILAIPFERVHFLPAFLQRKHVLIPISIFTVASFFSITNYESQIFDPPNDRYRKVISDLSILYSPKDHQLVIAHKSLAEMIIFTTDFDALNWLPPDNMQPQRVLRIINGLQFADFRRYLDAADVQQLQPISFGYFVAPEDVWQRFIEAASKDGNQNLMKRIYSDFNPTEKRPYFIDKGRTR